MVNPIKQIYQFNQQAGLLDKPYDDFLEASFQIEEALEGFEHLKHLANILEVDENAPKLPKVLSRVIVNHAQKGPARGHDHTRIWGAMPDIEKLDKALDAIVFAFGSIFKLGLTITQATRALNIVMQANLQKLEMPKDSHGKLMKPANFIGPEAKLQEILNER